MLTLTLMLTLVCVLMLVLMLVTAPLVGGRVVKRPPRGQVRTPPAPVRQDVIVEVVKIVVVRGVAVAIDAGGRRGGLLRCDGTWPKRENEGRRVIRIG
jgi:hypothetical protein